MEPTMVKHNSAYSGLEEDLERLYKFIEQFEGRDLDFVVSKLSEKLKVRKHEAARRLYKLKEQGLINFTDPDPPGTLLRYLFSTYCTWFWLVALAVTIVFAVIYILPGFPPFVYLRYVLGSIFVLYLPGSSLIELLYPRAGELSQLERLALSIGLSLALVPLVGLVLNYTPWGIRLDPIFASLSLLTISLAAGSVFRKFSILKLTVYASLQKEG
jgi:hypothetical protein